MKRRTRARTVRPAHDRVERIVALAVQVFEDEAAALRWLARPRIGLGAHTPMSHLTTEVGCREVESLLLRIEHGVYA